MGFGFLVPAPHQVAATSRQQGPELTIETFCASKGYAAGSDAIQLVGTIRNSGSVKLDDGVAKARMYLLTGLEYDQGDTAPKLPALEPGAAVTYRWKVNPSSDRGGLVASLVVQMPGSEPNVRIASIPHIQAFPRAEAALPIQGARARAGEQLSIENDRIRARIVQTDSEMPVMFLSTRSAAGWRTVGLSVPLAEVSSGEGGQNPWWEVFKVDEVRALNSPAESVLSLSGRFGIRWRATLDLIARPLSSVIEVRLRLSPTRQMRLYGVRLAPLLAGDGVPGFAVQDALAPQSSGTAEISAVHWSDVTVGALRQTEPIFKGWSAATLPPGEGADFRLLAAESRSPESPSLLDAGAMIQTRARIFALTPSTTSQDALKLIRPPAPVQRNDAK